MNVDRDEIKKKENFVRGKKERKKERVSKKKVDREWEMIESINVLLQK